MPLYEHVYLARQDVSAQQVEDLTKQFTAVIERDADTGVYVGWVPGFAGAHSQGDTLDELRAN